MRSAVLGLAGLALVAGPARILAQAPGGGHTDPAVEALPAGERLEYGLSLGPIHAGHATLTVGEAAEVEGARAYPVTLQVKGGALFLTLDDSLVSWIAAGPLRTVRSDRSVHEGPHREVYRLDLGGADGSAAGSGGASGSADADSGGGLRYHIVPLPGASGGPSADRPRSGPMPRDALDDVAVLFLPRSLPLDPGADYVIPRFFRPSSDPVRIHVAERRSMRTPAGTFDVVGLDVVIPETGLFDAKRKARVYVTDDADRTLVQLTAETALGTLRLYLTGEGE